jgi:hypothetical protein
MTDSMQADRRRSLPVTRHRETNAIDQDFERARGNAGLIATKRLGWRRHFRLGVDIG